MRLIPFFTILLAILVLVPATAVLAHSPVFPGENHSVLIDTYTGDIIAGWNMIDSN